MQRKHTNGVPIYPPTAWDITERQFSPAYNYRNETIFALGNGNIGMRGALEEGFSGAGCDGTYLNGFYESEPIRYPEPAYGYAEHSQTLLNVTNGKIIQLFVEEELFDMQRGDVREYDRTLRLKSGILERSLIWRSPKGREVKIEIQRLVSFQRRHIAAIRYRVTPLNFDGALRFVSQLDGDVRNQTTENDPRTGSQLQGRVLSVESRTADGSFGLITQRTQHTRFLLACAMDHIFMNSETRTLESSASELKVSTIYTVSGKVNKPITLEKFICYVTSRDVPEPALVAETRRTLENAKTDGFETLQNEQESFLANFWNHADIIIDGDDALQQGLRFNMFHLLQSVGRDGKTSIAAKGVTGEGYEGHYFWDTEMYVVPFFLHTSPRIARQLLEYRYGILDKARQRARQMAHARGALFAWRTIDGEECSTYYPAGTAQYHINADIAFAIKRYVEVTGDVDFLLRGGAEILFETARLWADLGSYIPHKGSKFCINGVTGPDEYTAVVNNNTFTNLMAQTNLRYARDVYGWLHQHHPEALGTLMQKVGLEAAEVEAWDRAAENMYLAFDERLGIYPQDDNFLDKAPWDFANTPPENYPLLIHYHPLVIYRHQVCKQADLVLALFLLSERFTIEEKKRNYDFYEPLTTHDSSLSSCVFSIVASEIGYRDKAYDYFTQTSRMDLDDTHGNVKDGVHIANMAGTWMSVVYGFAGMREQGERLSFRPHLPEKWNGYTFNMVFAGRLIRVAITRDQVRYELLEGDALAISHHEEAITLERDQPVTRRA